MYLLSLVDIIFENISQVKCINLFENANVALNCNTIFITVPHCSGMYLTCQFGSSNFIIIIILITLREGSFE